MAYQLLMVFPAFELVHKSSIKQTEFINFRTKVAIYIFYKIEV